MYIWTLRPLRMILVNQKEDDKKPKAKTSPEYKSKINLRRSEHAHRPLQRWWLSKFDQDPDGRAQLLVIQHTLYSQGFSQPRKQLLRSTSKRRCYTRNDILNQSYPAAYLGQIPRTRLYSIKFIKEIEQALASYTDMLTRDSTAVTHNICSLRLKSLYPKR